MDDDHRPESWADWEPDETAASDAEKAVRELQRPPGDLPGTEIALARHRDNLHAVLLLTSIRVLAIDHADVLREILGQVFDVRAHTASARRAEGQAAAAHRTVANIHGYVLDTQADVARRLDAIEARVDRLAEEVTDALREFKPKAPAGGQHRRDG